MQKVDALLPSLGRPRILVFMIFLGSAPVSEQGTRRKGCWWGCSDRLGRYKLQHGSDSESRGQQLRGGHTGTKITLWHQIPRPSLEPRTCCLTPMVTARHLGQPATPSSRLSIMPDQPPRRLAGSSSLSPHCASRYHPSRR